MALPLMDFAYTLLDELPTPMHGRTLISASDLAIYLFISIINALIIGMLSH